MPSLTIGALVYDYQVVDVIGPTDLLASAQKNTLKAFQLFGPIDEKTIARAPEFVFHHIGITKEPGPVATSAVKIVPTTTVDDCPELDMLILGGPNPNTFKLHPKYADFIRRHVAAGKLLFTTCTGSCVAALAGVMDGKKATVNNLEYEWVKKRHPEVNWTRAQKWIVDGNIWTGSGAVAGMDMFAHWIKENWGMDVLTIAARGLDYEPRDQHGLPTVLPKRHDSQGNQIPTHEFLYYDKY